MGAKNSIFIGHYTAHEATGDVKNAIVVGDHTPAPTKDGQIIIGDVLRGKPISPELRQFIIDNANSLRDLLIR